MNDVVLFDGECGFCGRAVAFIRANDTAGHFRYAPLTSGEGQALLSASGRDPNGTQALCLADATGLYVASDAALRIAGRLRAPWPLVARLAAVVPRRLRESVYRRIAASRYRLPG